MTRGDVRWAHVALPFLLVLLSPAGPAGAQTAPQQPAVEATAVPTTVTLVAGDVASVVVVVANRTTRPATVERTDITVPQRVAIRTRPDTSTPTPVPAGGVVRLPIEVSAAPGLEEGQIDVAITVAMAVADGAASSERVITATVAVKRGTSSQALTVAFLSSPARLGDGKRAPARLRIANETPFRFENIEVVGTGSTDLTLASNQADGLEACATDAPRRSASRLLGCVTALDPGASRVVSLDVVVDRRVRVGAQQVAVVVRGEAARPGGRVPSTAMASATVEVSLFGLDALGPFGVSSLFVLPGLMAVVVPNLLGRFAYPRRKVAPDAVNFKDPQVLAYVVPPAVLVYVVTYAAWGVDLTDAAGTGDVAMLFALGALLGTLVWALMAMTYWWRSGRMQFSESDRPAKVLYRLGARGVGLDLPEVRMAGRSYRFLAEAPDGGVTVCSPMAWTHREDASPDERRQFRTAVEDDDIAAVRDHVARDLVGLKWVLTTGVATFPATETQAGSPLPLLEEQA